MWAQDSEFREKVVGFRAYGSRFVFWFGVLNLGYGDSGFGIWGLRFGFRVEGLTVNI